MPSRRCLRSLPHWLIFVYQAPKPIAKFTPSPVQPASHRADWHVQDRSDFLVAPAVKVFQNHDGPVFRTKLVQGGFDDLLALGPFQRIRRVGIGRLVRGFIKPVAAASFANSPRQRSRTPRFGDRSARDSRRSGTPMCKTSCPREIGRVSRRRAETCLATRPSRPQETRTGAVKLGTVFPGNAGPRRRTPRFDRRDTLPQACGRQVTGSSQSFDD